MASFYTEIIAGATGEEDPSVLRELEGIMRDSIFHSTLDWQTREELEDAACLAARIRGSFD